VLKTPIRLGARVMRFRYMEVLSLCRIRLSRARKTLPDCAARKYFIRVVARLIRWASVSFFSTLEAAAGNADLIKLQRRRSFAEDRSFYCGFELTPLADLTAAKSMQRATRAYYLRSCARQTLS
jgi:hypothetical protein